MVNAGAFRRAPVGGKTKRGASTSVESGGRSEEFRKKLFACGSEVSLIVAAAGRDMD